MYGKTHARGASAPRAILFACLAVLAVVFALVRLEMLAVADRGLEVTLLVAGLLLLGSAVYLLAPVFSRGEQAQARAAYGTHRDVFANVVAAVAWGNLIFLPLLVLLTIGSDFMQEAWAGARTWQGALTATAEAVRQRPSLLVVLALVGLDIAFLLVVYLRGVRTGATTEREIGLVGSRFLRNVALGIAGWLAILLAVVTIGLLLAAFGVRQTQTEQLALGQATPSVFLLLLGAGSLLAPFAEEVFFRGYIFRSYLTNKGPVWAYVASSFLFAALHLNLPAFPALVVVGLILAYLYQRTGSLVAPIVAHGLNNAMALLAVYFLAGMQ